MPGKRDNGDTRRHLGGGVDGSKLFAVLRHQTLDVLGPLEIVVCKVPKPSRSRAAAVANLQKCPGGAPQVVAAICNLAKGESDGAAPWVYQHLRSVVGVLGTLESLQERRAPSARNLIALLTEQLAQSGDLATQRLEAIESNLTTANGIAAVTARRSELAAGQGGKGKTRDRLWCAALVQSILRFGDVEILAAINATGTPGRVLEPDAGRPYDAFDLPWVLNRYGGLVRPESWPTEAAWFDEHDPAHRLGSLLGATRDPALEPWLGLCSEDERTASAIRLVHQHGPRAVVERWFSEAQIWHWLTAQGLRLPPLAAVDRELLLELLFGALGLQYTPRPSGWYALAGWLRGHDWSATTTPLRLCKLVEQEYQTTLCAYLGLLDNSENEPRYRALSLAGERGLKVLGSLGASGPRAMISRQTFGQKANVMQSIAKLAQSTGPLREALEEHVDDPSRLGLLSGTELWGVVGLRNDIAHEDEPDLVVVRDAVLRWLEMAGVDDPARPFPLPMKIRSLRSTTDELQWTQAIYEDEQGRERRISQRDEWDLQGTIAMIGGSDDVIQPPRLVPL